MSARNLLILLLLLIAAMFAVRACKRPADPTAATGLLTPKPPPEQESLEKEVGVRRFAYDGSRLRVRVLPKGRCDIGDIDAIKLDLDHAKPPMLALSLEAPGGAPLTGQPPGRRFSRDELLSGFDHAFDVSRMVRPVHVGLYVCLDSADTARCADKPAPEINSIFRTYINEKPGPGYKAPDKIYYFAWTFLDRKESMTLDGPVKPAATYRQVARLVSPRLPASAVSTTEEALKSMQTLNRDLSSLMPEAPEKSGADMVVVLPFYDKSACK